MTDTIVAIKKVPSHPVLLNFYSNFSLITAGMFSFFSQIKVGHRTEAKDGELWAPAIFFNTDLILQAFSLQVCFCRYKPDCSQGDQITPGAASSKHHRGTKNILFLSQSRCVKHLRCAGKCLFFLSLIYYPVAVGCIWTQIKYKLGVWLHGNRPGGETCLIFNYFLELILSF